jgi:hypothetical protein
LNGMNKPGLHIIGGFCVLVRDGLVQPSPIYNIDTSEPCRIMVNKAGRREPEKWVAITEPIPLRTLAYYDSRAALKCEDRVIGTIW